MIAALLTATIDVREGLGFLLEEFEELGSAAAQYFARRFRIEVTSGERINCFGQQGREIIVRGADGDSSAV
jgi:hypothetical protein